MWNRCSLVESPAVTHGALYVAIRRPRKVPHLPPPSFQHKHRPAWKLCCLECTLSCQECKFFYLLMQSRTHTHRHTCMQTSLLPLLAFLYMPTVYLQRISELLLWLIIPKEEFANPLLQVFLRVSRPSPPSLPISP